MVALVLLFVLLGLVPSSNSDVRYVHPSDSLQSSCPYQPCRTLQQYSQENNIANGTTFLFLPGNHHIPQSMLNLTQVSSITLRGEPFASIICTNMVIRGENVTYLRIERLRFLLNCTGSQIYGLSALCLINCVKIFISNAVFQGSGNISMVPLGALSIERSRSTVNGCVFEGVVGGVVRASHAELTICGCSFIRNKGTGSGGVINAADSIIVLDGRIPNTFNHNTDKYAGGAVYCFRCTLQMSGNNLFLNNSALFSRHYMAPSRGGALRVYNGKLTISGNASIS